MKKTGSLLVWLAFVAALPSLCAAQDQIQVQVPGRPVSVSFLPVEEGVLVARVLDSAGEAVRGLTIEDFVVLKDAKKAKILSAEPLETSEKVGLNIVLVVDNSDSMRQRDAVQPLLNALNEFFKILRPIDTVHAVVFDGKGAHPVGERRLRVRTITTGDVTALKGFFDDAFGQGLTHQTFLYEGILAGLDLAARIPQNQPRLMAVFSDGEDLNSAFKPPVVEAAAAATEGLDIYTIDYMPTEGKDPFLTSLAENNGGRIWKAASAGELLPIFLSLSTTMRHAYVLTYRFLFPPKGTVSISPETVVIEEVTAIDSSPLLNYVYFDTGKSEIPPRYALFGSRSETQGFDESSLRGTMEKYPHLLNIIGKRMLADPQAVVTLVGCNSHTGVERGRVDLSRSRAEEVRAYLRYIWGIDQERIQVEARNLPPVPSTNRLPEGQVENQRVEILSDSPAILDTIQSTYMEAVSNVEEIVVVPEIFAEHGVARWRVGLKGGDDLIAAVSGEGPLQMDYRFSVAGIGLEKLQGCESLAAEIEVTDAENFAYQAVTERPAAIRFVRRQERVAQRMGYKVLERYALILFDFDRADIKARNQVVVERIISRMREVPQATATIVGHTDTIGTEEYNLSLSQRRAKAVYDQMTAAGMAAGETITHQGVGPSFPLYDNGLPEGRALNRTVTVTLSYEQKE